MTTDPISKPSMSPSQAAILDSETSILGFAISVAGVVWTAGSAATGGAASSALLSSSADSSFASSAGGGGSSLGTSSGFRFVNSISANSSANCAAVKAAAENTCANASANWPAATITGCREPSAPSLANSTKPFFTMTVSRSPATAFREKSVPRTPATAVGVRIRYLLPAWLRAATVRTLPPKSANSLVSLSGAEPASAVTLNAVLRATLTMDPFGVSLISAAEETVLSVSPPLISSPIMATLPMPAASIISTASGLSA